LPEESSGEINLSSSFERDLSGLQCFYTWLSVYLTWLITGLERLVLGGFLMEMGNNCFSEYDVEHNDSTVQAGVSGQARRQLKDVWIGPKECIKSKFSTIKFPPFLLTHHQQLQQVSEPELALYTFPSHIPAIFKQFPPSPSSK
jgi:hypothetical protein